MKLPAWFQDVVAMDAMGWTATHAAAYHGRLGALQVSTLQLTQKLSVEIGNNLSGDHVIFSHFSLCGSVLCDGEVISSQPTSWEICQVCVSEKVQLAL